MSIISKEYFLETMRKLTLHINWEEGTLLIFVMMNKMTSCIKLNLIVYVQLLIWLLLFGRFSVIYIWRCSVLFKIPSLVYCSIICHDVIVLFYISKYFERLTTTLFFSRSGIHHMRILENSKEPLDNFKLGLFLN